MARKQIKELDAHSSILDTDVLPIQNSTTWDAEKSTASELASYIKTTNNSFDKSSDTLDDIDDWATYVKSENNFTDILKTKLDWIEEWAEVNTVDSVAWKTWVVTLIKWDVWLWNVDNTSDIDKPISDLTQTALDWKLDSVVAWTNITVDDTDPLNPTISAISWAWSPLTTKWDLYTYSSTNTRLWVWTDWQTLTADSSEPTWLKWNVPAWWGDVLWPTWATDNAIPRYDWATWKLLQDSNITIDDLDNIENAKSITLTDWEAITWNADDYTINIPTWLWPILQAGQEEYVVVYNNTWVQIDNFKAIKATWVFNAYQTVWLANSKTFQWFWNRVLVTTMDIPNWSYWIATRFGKVRDVDTLSYTAWQPIYLWTTDWEITETRPEFPNYKIVLWWILKKDTTTWIAQVNIVWTREDTVIDSWDWSIRESFDFRITSDWTTITWTLQNSDLTNNLTLILSDWFYIFDTTPWATVTLTAWTATLPQMNYVYIDKSTKALTVSTSWFPTTEHCKVAKVSLLTAWITQTDWALRNQNINDHIKSVWDNGHILHMAERLRTLNASWDNWIEATLTGTPTNWYIQTTWWQVWQMHRQTFVAKSMPTDDIHVVNDPTTPYTTISDLATTTVDSEWATLNNKRFSFIIRWVANKTGEESHLMVNLPSWSYNSEWDALADADWYSVYDIPKDFQWVWFLIARFTVKLSWWALTYTSTTWYQDLRWKIPNATAWSWTGSSWVTTFTWLTDTPSAYTGQALKVPRVNSWETALEFVTPWWAFSTTSNVTSNTPWTLATDDFVFGSDDLDDDWNTDHDKRFIFDKSTWAFRAGYCQWTERDDTNRWDYSIWLWKDVIATWSAATALWNNTIASWAENLVVWSWVENAWDNSLSVWASFKSSQKRAITVWFWTSVATEDAAVRLEADADQNASKKAAIYLKQSTAASSTTDRLQNIWWTLYFNWSEICWGWWSSSLINIATVDWQLYTWRIWRYVVSDWLTISNVKASLETLPTTTSVKIDIRLNGTDTTDSIFTSDTPLEITTSESATNWVYTVDKTAIDNWTVVEDDVLYIYATQVGTSWVTGSDLTLNIS